MSVRLLKVRIKWRELTKIIERKIIIFLIYPKNLRLKENLQLDIN